jgi:hypothetical protein
VPKEFEMTRNLGAFDRGLRILIGLLLVAYAVPIGFPVTGWNWVGWIGVVPLLTAILGMCPAYGLLGINSCGR